ETILMMELFLFLIINDSYFKNKNPSCKMRSFFYEENVIYWINKITDKRGYNMKQEFAVIGLGRFGGSMCRELSMEGMNVLAIDRDEDKINEFKNTATYAVIADATDEMTLKELGINNIDHVIVAIGDNIQAS